MAKHYRDQCSTWFARGLVVAVVVVMIAFGVRPGILTERTDLFLVISAGGGAPDSPELKRHREVEPGQLDAIRSTYAKDIYNAGMKPFQSLRERFLANKGAFEEACRSEEPEERKEAYQPDETADEESFPMGYWKALWRERNALEAIMQLDFVQYVSRHVGKDLKLLFYGGPTDELSASPDVFMHAKVVAMLEQGRSAGEQINSVQGVGWSTTKILASLTEQTRQRVTVVVVSHDPSRLEVTNLFPMPERTRLVKYDPEKGTLSELPTQNKQYESDAQERMQLIDDKIASISQSQ